MEALELFGNGIFLTIGVVIGAAIMYFCEVIIDKEEE